VKLQGSTVLVTGVGADNLGQHFAQQLLKRGASKVYATARRPERITVPGVEVLHLDLTDASSIAAAADVAAQTNVLINNAARFEDGTEFLTGDIERIRGIFDTNVFGTLDVIRAFAPVLALNGGGAILNVLSAMAWSTFAGINVYGASKAAAWSLTNAVRDELADQNTQVTSLVFGMAGTASMRAYADAVAKPGALDAVITAPEDIVSRALDGLEAGDREVLGDQLAIDAKAALSGQPRSVYTTLAADYGIEGK
jgi:short-subunit dehydrogenase